MLCPRSCDTSPCFHTQAISTIRSPPSVTVSVPFFGLARYTISSHVGDQEAAPKGPDRWRQDHNVHCTRRASSSFVRSISVYWRQSNHRHRLRRFPARSSFHCRPRHTIGLPAATLHHDPWSTDDIAAATIHPGLMFWLSCHLATVPLLEFKKISHFTSSVALQLLIV